MSSTVFSISLNELDMAKLGELQDMFPNLSRNGMIRRIINLAHLEELGNTEDVHETNKHLENQIKDLARRVQELSK